MSLLQQIQDAMGETECDVAIPPVTDKEELVGRIAESVTAKDSRTLQAYILEQRLPEPEQFWELTTLLAPCLTTENLEEKPRFFTTVRRCLTHFSRHGRPKEMVLAFLEVMEGFQDDALFITLLPCLQNALLQLPVKRGRSLELALDTLSCHILAIPAPQNWNLEGEETKLLETDETVQRFLNVVPAFIEFMQPFLEGGGSEGEGSGRQWELRVLKKHLLQLLQHPLAFLDLRFNSKEGIPKTYSREMAESVVQALTHVEKDFYRLLVQNPADGKTTFSNLREKNRESSPKNAEVEDTDMEAENSENERRASGTAGNQDNDSTEDEFSELSGACLAYLVQVEWLGQQCWPVVYSHSHLLHANLRYVHVLLTNAAHTAVYKGLALLSFYLDLLADFSLSVDTLDDENFMPVVNALITVMRFCPIRELRLSGLCVFKTFFTKLDCQGRYQLMNSVLASCEHAGVKAVVVGLVKDEIDSALRQMGSNQAGGKDSMEAASAPQATSGKHSLQKAAETAESLPVYFFNDRLKQLLTLATKLSAGATTDLLEESDLIMATLNLLRYLVLRDSCSSSLTGIWSMVAWLEKDYLSALRTGLDMSVGHYQLELNNLKTQSHSGGGEGIMSTGDLASPYRPRFKGIFAEAMSPKSSVSNILELLLTGLTSNPHFKTKCTAVSAMSSFCSHLPNIYKNTKGINPKFATESARQLLRGHCRNFSRTCWLGTADVREATAQNSERSEDGEGSSSHFDQDTAEQEEYDTRQQILRAALPFVHQHGWTQKAIAAGAETEGFPSVSHGMFPRGGAELVHFFYASSNQALATILAEKVKQQGDQKPKTREFIRDAVETRLRMIVPYIDTWPQAMAIQALPQNAVESWTNLANLVDEIWYYAGDRSVDFNWYTKRGSLAGLYKATEIYMLQDKSEDNVDTWAFLDRRLDGLQTFGKIVRNSSQMSTVMKEGFWGMCIVGRNVLGMNPRER